MSLYYKESKILTSFYYCLLPISNDKKVEVDEIKNIFVGIFGEKFNTFFSDFLYEDGKDKVEDYKKADIRIKQDGDLLTITGLDGIEINIEINSKNNFNLYKLDIVSSGNITLKQEIFIEVILGYLIEKGLDFKNKDSGVNQKIKCEDGVCNFVTNLKEDLYSEKTEKLIKILKLLMSEDFGDELDDLIKDCKYSYSIEKLKFKFENFIKTDNKKTDIDKLKLKIIYQIIGDLYKEHIINLASYINAINTQVLGGDFNKKVKDVLENNNNKKNYLSDKDIKNFRKIKIILEKNLELYKQKLSDINIKLKKEESKKEVLEQMIDSGFSLNPIIQEIKKDLPTITKFIYFFNRVLMKLIPKKEEIEAINDKEQEKKDFDFEKFKENFEEFKEEKDTFYNYELLIRGVTANTFKDIDINLDNGLEIKTYNGYRKVIDVVKLDFMVYEIVLEKKELSEKYEAIRDYIKIYSIYDRNEEKIKKYIFNEKTRKKIMEFDEKNSIEIVADIVIYNPEQDIYHLLSDGSVFKYDGEEIKKVEGLEKINLNGDILYPFMIESDTKKQKFYVKFKDGEITELSYKTKNLIFLIKNKLFFAQFNGTKYIYAKCKSSDKPIEYLDNNGKRLFDVLLENTKDIYTKDMLENKKIMITKIPHKTKEILEIKLFNKNGFFENTTILVDKKLLFYRNEEIKELQFYGNINIYMGKTKSNKIIFDENLKPIFSDIYIFEKQDNFSYKGDTYYKIIFKDFKEIYYDFKNNNKFEHKKFENCKSIKVRKNGKTLYIKYDDNIFTL